MPVLKAKERGLKVAEPTTQDDTQAMQDPLAGKQLQCPYCGWVYLPEEGCFCLRLVGWGTAPSARESHRPAEPEKERRS